VGFNKQQTKKYIDLYNYRAKAHDDYQYFLFKKEKIPFVKTFDKKTDEAFKDMYLYYNILNDIQKLPNKKTYLLTFTDSYNIEATYKKFFKYLNNLKGITRFNGLEFDYFSIIEPKRDMTQHLHIKLVIDGSYGIHTALKNIISKIDNKFVSIKKQNADNNDYLLKMIKKDYKAYSGWLADSYKTIKKSVKRSRYIKINDNNKIILKEYKKVLSFLLKQKPEYRIGLKEVKEYINKKPSKQYNLYNILNRIAIGIKQTNYILKSKTTLYIYLIKYHKFILNYIFYIIAHNNSPNLEL
jgi:hypothetical protein